MAVSGINNPMWKGGCSIASNGYVLIRVGIGHHLADVRGYAYEHRLVAEEILGRPLRRGEIVHHLDENKQNNDKSNLKVEESIGTHRTEHRARADRGLRMPGEPNKKIKCACGCGEKIDKYDKSGRPRRFITGHNIIAKYKGVKTHE